MERMSMAAADPFAGWSVRNLAIVGAFVGGALAVRKWRQTRRAIRAARVSGDRSEVVARMSAVLKRDV
jgi:hypothetical protein